MAKRIFEIELRGTARIELDDAVIDRVDDDFRSSLYNLHGAQEIAEHVGYNLIVNGGRLSIMDGWADMDNDNARVLGVVDWTTEASEVSTND